MYAPALPPVTVSAGGAAPSTPRREEQEQEVDTPLIAVLGTITQLNDAPYRRLKKRTQPFGFCLPAASSKE